MAINKKVNNNFCYSNTQKLNKNFMYQDLKRGNCYNTNFTGSNFDYTSLRGTHLKACDCYECTFRFAEFVGSNLKKSKFKEAKFENTLFEGVNLDGVDFRGAQFKNTVFLATDVTKAINLDLKNPEIRIFDEMPKVEISENLEQAIKDVMENEYVKASRVLDTKDGNINNMSIMLLLENFDEQTLVKGFNLLGRKLDKHFCVLSYIIRLLKNYESQGLI